MEPLPLHLQVAYSFGLSIKQAAAVVDTLNLDNLQEIENRFLCSIQKYITISDLHTDLFNMFGELVPYVVVSGLIFCFKNVENYV